MKINQINSYWKRISRLGRKIFSFTDVLNRLDIREVLSVMYLDGYDTG